MSIAQKLTYKIAMYTLTNNSSGPYYLPLPNRDQVQQEMQLLEAETNNLNFHGLKNLLLEKINYLNQNDLSLEAMIYHHSTFPDVIEHLFSKEEIKNGLIDAMNDQEFEVVLINLVQKISELDFITQPDLKVRERLRDCFKALLKEDRIENRILDIIENIYFTQPQTSSKIIAVIQLTNNRVAFDLLTRLHKSPLGANEVNRYNQALLLERILNRLTKAQEKEGINDSDLPLIYNTKNFIDEILQREETNEETNFIQKIREIRQSLEILQPGKVIIKRV